MAFFHHLVILTLSFLHRLESSFRSSSRPLLHSAARIVLEMGKSRAAAFALGVYEDEGADLQAYDVESSDLDLNESSQRKGSLF